MSNLSTSLYNRAVRRNNRYQDVVNLLVFGSLEGSNKQGKIFDNIKDLIIFAAMVGKKYEKKEVIDPKDNTSIVLGTFSGSGSTRGSRVGQHDVIFMFGLLIDQDVNAIRDENISLAIQHFELYSNGGLSIIKDWLTESAWRPLVLEQKIMDEINLNNTGKIVVEDNPF